MAESTSISWSDATFNPWVGCTKVSPGCLGKNCYAETLVQGRMGRGNTWGPKGTRERTSVSNWAKPHRWNRLAADGLLPDGSPNADGHRPRVFCASLADVFEDRPEVDPWRRDLFDVIAATPNLDWLLLTKRPDLAAEWLRAWYADMQQSLPLGGALPFEGDGTYWHLRDNLGWGVLPNLWIGTSIESTAYTWRADELRRIPAAVRFISAEPLLGSLFTLPLAAPGGSGVDQTGAMPPVVEPPDAARSSVSDQAPSASPGDGPGTARRLATGASGAEGKPLTEGATPRGADTGEAPGGIRNRSDAAGADDDVQSAVGRGSGSSPDLSTQHPRPLTESVPAGRTVGDDALEEGPGRARRAPLDLTGIDWVIVGGESGGRNARPMHPDWAREIRDAVLAAGMPPGGLPHGEHPHDYGYERPALHFKQWGSWGPGLPKPGDYVTYLAPEGRRSDRLETLLPGPAVVYRGSSPKSSGKLLDGVEYCEFPSPAAPLVPA